MTGWKTDKIYPILLKTVVDWLVYQSKLRVYIYTIFIYNIYMNNEKIQELKQIAEKIAELDAKVRAMQLMGNVDGAMSAKKGLRFAKQVFAQKQRQLRGVSR